MRVTHIITRLIIGGAQENTVSSVLGLRKRWGHDVHLISGVDKNEVAGNLYQAFDREPGVLQLVDTLVRPVHPWKDWIALRTLIQFLREQKPQLVHTHSGKAGVLGRLAAAKANVPVIVHTIHGPSFGGFQGRVPNLVFRKAEQYTARVTTHFVVVAESMRDQYLQAGIGQPDQYTRIASGFRLEPFLNATNNLALRRSLGFSKDDIIVGKIARLFPLKGHDDLLDCAASWAKAEPRIKLLLIGDGSLRAHLEHKARALGVLDRVRFAGLLPPSKVPDFIGIMDMLVHLSRREGLPRALPQALAAGKPVIAYDCDGAHEVCLEGKTGFLVKPGDLAGLKQRVLELAANAPLCNRLAEAGRAKVITEFSEEAMVDQLHQLYQKLAAE